MGVKAGPEATRLLGSGIHHRPALSVELEDAMSDPQVGWIAAIVIGGLAGWLAELFMKSDMELSMNILSASMPPI